MAAATEALCSSRARLAATVRPPVAAAIRLSTKGVTAPPVTPVTAASVERGVDDRRQFLEGDLVAFRDGGRDEDAAAVAHGPGGPDHGRDLGRRSHRLRDRQTAAAGPESGELTVRGVEAEDRHTERLQPLQGAGQVEERLRPGADRHHRVAGQRQEIGTLVAGLRPVAVHTADPPGGEHRDAGRAANATEADTVVAAAAQPWATATATSRSPTLRSAANTRPNSESSTPIRAIPSSTTANAATAPPPARASSDRDSAWRPAGSGSPNRLKTVDSSATTGRPSARAACTGAETTGPARTPTVWRLSGRPSRRANCLAPPGA